MSNIEIATEHRRKRRATRAFEALEPVVRELGFSAIGLNVFAYNTGAQALYAIRSVERAA